MLVETAVLRYSIDMCGTPNSPLQKNEYLLWVSLLDQRNAIQDDGILMENQLQSIKEQLTQLHTTSPDSMSKTDFDQVSHTMEQLEAFQKLSKI